MAKLDSNKPSVPSQFYYKNNRLQQIRGFYNTVTYGSLTKAAKIMGLTQSSISLQIKTLERDLGCQLIKRDKKNSLKFNLTEDGKIFYEMATPVLNGADGICDKFLLKSKKYHNNFLKIVGHHSVFSILVPGTLKKLKNANKSLKLKLSYAPKQEAISQIEDEKLDIAIYPMEELNLVPNNLIFKKIADYKPALIMPLNHPLSKIPDKEITFEEIGKYNYIHTGDYAISDVMKYNLASKTLQSDIDLHNGSWDTLRALVSAGLGVTIFHEDYCKDFNNIVVKKVRHLSPKIAYYAIYKNGCQPKQLVLDLIDDIAKRNIKAKK